MVLKKGNYIYIATNTGGFGDDQLISALLGYVPIYTKYERIYQFVYNVLWSRTKLLREESFDVIEAKRRLQEWNEKLNFTVTNKGDIIVYRNVNNEVLRILDAYYEYNGIPIVEGSKYSFNSHTTLTMPRNLGRSAAISMLNSLYGLNPIEGLLNWNTWCYEFKLYFGVERATGKQKTVCLWKDGEKTIIRGDESVLRMPVQYAVAWCYVKRIFKTTSQFKKYVDNHSHIMDGMTYFEGDARVKGAQASTNNRTKKYDIYDAAALAITAKCYGSVKTIMNYCDGWGE